MKDKTKENLTEIFDAASPEQKRVMIAADALARLDTKQLIAETGRWVEIWETPVGTKFNADVQDLLLNKSGFKCNVCALGSLLMGAIRFKNSVDLEDLEGLRQSFDSLCWLPQNITNYFSEDQLQLIEFTYEGGNGWFTEGRENLTISKEDQVKALKFSQQSKDPDTRLRMILKNIIANNGTFVV